MPYEACCASAASSRGPGVPAGKVVADPVSTLDLPATFYDYAGVSRRRALQSRSLRPLIERDDATRDFAYSEWHLHPSRCGVALALRTVRTRTHKLTFELELRRRRALRPRQRSARDGQPLRRSGRRRGRGASWRT